MTTFVDQVPEYISHRRLGDLLLEQPIRLVGPRDERDVRRVAFVATPADGDFDEW